MELYLSDTGHPSALCSSVVPSICPGMQFSVKTFVMNKIYHYA